MNRVILGGGGGVIPLRVSAQGRGCVCWTAKQDQRPSGVWTRYWGEEKEDYRHLCIWFDCWAWEGSPSIVFHTGRILSTREYSCMLARLCRPLLQQAQVAQFRGYPVAGKNTLQTAFVICNTAPPLVPPFSIFNWQCYPQESSIFQQRETFSPYRRYKSVSRGSNVLAAVAPGGLYQRIFRPVNPNLWNRGIQIYIETILEIFKHACLGHNARTTTPCNNTYFWEFV